MQLKHIQGVTSQCLFEPVASPMQRVLSGRASIVKTGWKGVERQFILMINLRRYASRRGGSRVFHKDIQGHKDKILESERMPEEWRRSVLVLIFKNKGDVKSWGNYKGIKLMEHTMKL